jgi:ferredoxin-NADP reductase/ferredoxin
MAADGDSANAPGGVSVTLRFEDGAERRIVVAPGQFVLDAALAQGAPLVYQCRSGSCSTCVATLIEGEIAPAPGRPIALLASEVADGRRLLCVSYAHAPSVIREHYPAALIAAAAAPRVFSTTLSAIERPNPKVAIFKLAVEDKTFTFESGQYVRIRIPHTDEWRSYSMASAAHDLPAMTFIVRLIAGGAMSEYLLRRARAGDRLEIEGPRGAFVLRRSRGLHIFVAGGTGLAPILSMLDAIRRRPGPRPPMLLSFGCSRDAEFFARDEIELRLWWMPELRAILSAGRIEGPDDGLRRGNPVNALDAAPIDAADASAYLCGPPAMIEAARARLAARGVALERIYAERFVAS